MSRVSSALLGANAYGKGVNTAVLDLQYGGQMGFAPDLSEWVSNQQYTRRNLIALLVEAPKGFQYLSNPTYWVATLRALVELHPIRITGLAQGLEVETAETPVGGGGEMHEDFTDVKRARSQITFTWNEKYGMPVTRFLAGWIRYLMMDPDTKVALINTISGNSTTVTDMLADMYSATMLFIEPDPTHTKVVKSWLVTNMWPKGTGEITGQRDVTAAQEKLDVDVQFAGIAQTGLGVDAFAQTIMSGISITGANPYTRAAFVTALDSNVTAATKSYSSNVTATINSNVSV